MTLALRIAARFQMLAAQPAGQRERARALAQPINKPRGIDKSIVKDNAEVVRDGDEIVKPHRRDIQPKDVFTATPKNTGVLNLVQTGKDLSRAIDQVPKDKGYQTVNNLSQYLIWTHGGSGGGPQGKKQ